MQTPEKARTGWNCCDGLIEFQLVKDGCSLSMSKGKLDRGASTDSFSQQHLNLASVDAFPCYQIVFLTIVLVDVFLESVYEPRAFDKLPPMFTTKEMQV